MTDSDSQEPKIIVDTDWKEQVAKEKELASEQFVPKPASDQSEQLPGLPPATFEILVSMLFTQAMAMLGQIPDPAGGESQINKPFAKHTIDTLEMLDDKTTGNLTEDESKMLAEALHALRMAYVNTKA